MNRQDLFDRAVAGIRKQGGLALTDNGLGCLYLTKDGRRCAIGHLLPEGHPALSPKVGMGVTNLFRNYPDLNTYFGVASDDIQFLIELQRVHDKAGFATDYTSNPATDHLPRFETAARALAEHYGLTYTPPGGAA